MSSDSDEVPSPITPKVAKLGNCLRPGLYLDVSRTHQVWDPLLGEYVRKKTEDVRDGFSEAVASEEKKYAFTIRRYFNPSTPGEAGLTTTVESWSPYFLEAAKEVMKHVGGLSFTNLPFEVDFKPLLTHFDHFQAYRDELNSKEVRTHQESLILEHLTFFLRFFHDEFSTKIKEVKSLIAQGMISYDLLHALFVPGEIVYALEVINKQPSAMKYLSTSDNSDSLSIAGEYLQRVDNDIGFADFSVSITRFEGLKKIDTLDVFPMRFHPRAKETTEMLIKRGRKAYNLGGIQHVHYSGVAYPTSSVPDKNPIIVNGRIILDKASFYIYSGEYGPKTIQRDLDGKDFVKNQRVGSSEIPPDEALMVSAAYLYGFDLTTKLWFFFNVDDISEVRWNEKAFAHLALPSDHKELVESLVTSHKQGNGLDGDFIEDKGSGLILSLFGPPGVGKTLTAEATSELTRRPLYVVSAGELGSVAADVETNLRRIFKTAAQWNAILLIDEADVFLERRTRGDLTRNAIVAVMLRELEYFPGILILTTNRMVVFDDALESRIHVSLHYPELGSEAKESIWRAFFSKAGVSIPTNTSILPKLVKLPLNGRQIKNIVNTANLLARSQKVQFDEQQAWRVAHLSEDPFRVDDGAEEEKRLWISILVLVCILFGLGVEQIMRTLPLIK